MKNLNKANIFWNSLAQRDIPMLSESGITDRYPIGYLWLFRDAPLVASANKLVRKVELHTMWSQWIISQDNVGQFDPKVWIWKYLEQPAEDSNW